MQLTDGEHTIFMFQSVLSHFLMFLYSVTFISFYFIFFPVTGEEENISRSAPAAPGA